MAGEREDAQVVVQEDAGGVGGQTQDESLIKPVDNVLVSLSPEPGMGRG